MLRLNLSSDTVDLGGMSPLAGISRLQHLQHLALDLPYDAPKTFLPGVPTGLTHLELQSRGCQEEVEPVVLRHIPQLRHLQSLSINQSINVTPVAMKLKKLMPAIH
jgi:hypothetical protein